jgi:hypothetical protein
MSERLQDFAGGELLKMVEPKWVGRIVLGITGAIEHSFKTDLVLRPVNTRSEIERRFKICIKWFVILRRDLHWSCPKIIDSFKELLRSELDGGKWDPDKQRDSWVGTSPSVQGPVELQDDGGEDLSGDVPNIDATEAEGV